MRNYIKQLTILFVSTSIYLSFPLVLCAAEHDTELNTEKDSSAFTQNTTSLREKKGNILNIILDKSPQVSTERGTLIVEAYYDKNNNQQWDNDEYDLKGEITCTLDNISYQIPAFIPALDYNARYKISCQGSKHYQPTKAQKNVLISRRGQIINMAIPCHPVPYQH
ncbi:MAG: hypothetical protein U9R29_01925 [Thermodesulfobacteriota bacterium]|nr:hypothetical protein [Thermodesulfobacteriota bacterium]